MALSKIVLSPLAIPAIFPANFTTDRGDLRYIFICLLGFFFYLPMDGFCQQAKCTAAYRFDGQKVELSESEWKKVLTLEQFIVLREKGTELAFCNLYHDNKEKGLYVCAGCALPIYSSEGKYDSGTGWPSFWHPICPENIVTREDHELLETRIEVSCSRCDGHLGHVFYDGPPPTGLRYCMNSFALKFIPND